MAAGRKSLEDALPNGHIAGGQTALPAGIVKSAGRALQVLELFDVLQREASVLEISELLSYPQSSTSMLLRSLVQMGYLLHNPKARTYISTKRVALLGKWIDDTIIGDGHLLKLMKRVRDATGQAVVLATRNGMHAQYIHVVQATDAARLYVVQGSKRSLIRSGAGYAILAQMNDAQIKRIAMRINAEAGEGDPIVSIVELMEIVAEVRHQGYAASTNIVTPGAGIVAMAIPDSQAPGSDAPLVLGIGGVSEILRAREHEMVATLRREIERHVRHDVAPKAPVDPDRWRHCI
jgi:DNA-binding IclR family transcriptional regulator